MKPGFDGLMMTNVWKGLQLKKEKQIKSLPLYVNRLDGQGREKVVFKEVQEFDLPNEYTLIGTCDVRGEEHTFEYRAPLGRQNSTIIGFQPKERRTVP